jgi:hypothetical protein
LLFVGVNGCSERVDTPSDAGVDGDAGVVDERAPQIPWLAEGRPPIALPVLTPCPAGWVEIENPDGVVECEPYPDGRQTDCLTGEAHFPGEGGCRPIGTACPPGVFPTDLPADTMVVYIDDSAEPGGDGSQSAPYTSLTEVSWSSLPTGTTVALAKGSYDGTVALKAGTALVGACAAETILTGQPLGDPPPPVVQVNSPGSVARLRDLSIRSPNQAAISVSDGRALLVSGVLIEGVLAFGVLVSDGGRVDLADVVVTGTRLTPVNGRGAGIFVSIGGELRAERLLLVDNASVALLAISGRAEIEDGLIADTQLNARGEDGHGLNALEGGQIVGRRLLIERNQRSAVSVGNAAVRLSDTIVRDTLAPDSADVGGLGLDSFREGAIELSRTVVSGNREAAITLNYDARADLTDVVLRETSPRTIDDRYGRAINAQYASHVVAERVLIADNHDIAVFTLDPGTTTSLTDVSIHRTASDLVRPTGTAIEVAQGAQLSATRVGVYECRNIGIRIEGTGTTATFVDAFVSEAMVATNGLIGWGVLSMGGASVDLERVVVSDSHEAGFVIGGSGTAVRASDVALWSESTAYLRGIQVQEGASFVGARLSVDGAAGNAIVSVADAMVELSQVTVGTMGVGAPDGHVHGLVSSFALMSVRDFLVQNASACGALVQGSAGLDPSAGLDLQNGLIRDSTIGACVDFEGFDIGRISAEVRYEDNGSNLDSSGGLPVPMVLTPPVGE